MHRRKPSSRRRGHSDGQVSGDRAANDALARAIVDWCEFFTICSLDACSRARRCRGDGVPCFDADACHFHIAEMPVGQRLFEVAVAAEEDSLFE
jgi:hypothetical protein